MPTDQRPPGEYALVSGPVSRRVASPRSRRALLRTNALVALSIAAPLWVSSDAAQAMGFRGVRFGGVHTASALSRGSTVRVPTRSSRVGLRGARPTWTLRRLGSGLVRPSSEGGDGPPRHPPGSHHPIIGFPLPPLGPTPIVNVRRSGPSGLIGPIGPAEGAAGGIAPSGVTATNDRRFVPDEVLVSFAASVPPQAIVSFAQGQRLALLGIHRLSLIDTVLYRFRITDRREVLTVLGSLRGDGRVAAAQPNFLYSLQDDGPPGVPTGDPAQYVVSKLHLPQAHDLAIGNRVLVAVIDSAIDAVHPELQGAIVGRFDAVKSDPLSDKHGTAMASAIAAHRRLVGVAPGVTILAVRAFGVGTAGVRSTTTRILDSLQWTANSGARVVNMSFTGPADSEVHAMIAALRRKGAVLVAAAGNDGPQAAPEYPAAYPEVIGVTATDVDDHLLSVANHGPYVAVAAPGVDIFVAAPNAGYDFTTGTSVATAHVSGLAALLLERNPALTPDAVQSILMRTARDLGPKGRDDEFGAGLIDPYEALLALERATAARAPGP